MTATMGIRLPAHVQPRRYALTLTPNLTEFTFQGEESVELQITDAAASITLHALELAIAWGDVTLPDGRTLPATAIQLDEESETATLSFGEPVPPGTATLRLGFSGTLNDQLRGFYRSQYLGPDGQPRNLATTQFEATDARRAFPCWDEPAAKAVFGVTLVVPAELTAISNMPIESEQVLESGLREVRFADSPPMSTYLVAFVVGDMASIEATAPGGTLVRIFTTRGREHLAGFALDNAVRVLAFFNDYFGIPYPLAKLDHIAIPDFAAGAMENWGAVTYRETALLHDPENSAAATRQRILEVIAHETAHMWFGDLVTMEWWDALWLNESFASWIGTKAVNALEPDWQVWTQFVSKDTNNGLGFDSLINSHPVEVPVEHPAQIREIFDAISYSKGGAVLRMLEDYVGEENFRKGLQQYLSAHQYGNARSEDLWNAVGAASSMPVPDVMHSWIKQVGFPFVQAQPDGDSLKLTQRRFLFDYLLGGAQDDPSLWKIPVSAMRQGAAEKTAFLMDEREQTATLNGGAADGWVKANWGQHGFYRVNYGAAEWDRLREAVRRLELSPVDRLGLQNDAYALARAGLAPATRFVSLAEAYADETDATVWIDLSMNLGGVENLLVAEPFLPSFEAFGRKLYAKIVRQVGWDAAPGEGHLTALLRSTALAMAGGYGDPDIVAEAKTRLGRYLENSASVHPNLRGVVLSLAAQHADPETYERLWELARRTELQEEKLRLLRAMASFPQAELIRATLGHAIGPDVRSQDSIMVVGAVSGNRQGGRAAAWDFIRENWGEFDRRYGRGGAAITNLVSITGGFTTLERAAEVESFFKAHPAPSAARTIEQSLERIRLNDRWLERNAPSLASWFAARV